MKDIGITPTPEEERAIRINALKGMHEIIIGLGDETIYERWIIGGVPDCPQEDDFEFIAENEEEFTEVFNLYTSLLLEE